MPSNVLNWTASPDPGVLYYIYRSDTPTGPRILLASDVAGTTFTDTTAVAGATYYYTVKAGVMSIFSNQVTITSPGTTVVGTSAIYEGTDPTTQGNWGHVYGMDGVDLPSYTDSPTYAALTPEQEALWTWAASTTDKRALTNPVGGVQVANCWYNNSFDFDLVLNDNQAHKVSFYFVDWDLGGRTQTVTISDAVTGAVLDTRTVSSFTGGVYLVWNISGHVKITFKTVLGPNAVCSGVFFN